MHRLYGQFVEGRGAIGLLFLRLVCGFGLMLHGFPKIQEPFSWMGSDATVMGVFQALAAVAEFGGGLALILGLLVPVACFGIVCNMATAIFMVHLAKGHPFVASPGGHGSYESALIYLAVAFLFMLIGPGAYSLDAILFSAKTKMKTRIIQRHRVSV